MDQQAFRWISKLFGFDFTMEYRPGRLNTVADALSRRDVETGRITMLSGPTFKLYDDIRREVQQLPAMIQVHERIMSGKLQAPWQVQDGLILHSSKVFLDNSSSLLQTVLDLAHCTGHEGVQKTLQRLRANFFIQHDRAAVQDFVKACTTCQRNKTETLHPAGLLQPLPVPSQTWADISPDFVEGLPRVHGKSVILTVLDRFSKYAHFIALSHPCTAAMVAKAFFEGIVHLHGFPMSIVSDRYPVFTGNFWKDLFKMSGVKLRMSTAFHPQTDGQSEVVNRTIAMYLRCITGD